MVRADTALITKGRTRGRISHVHTSKGEWSWKSGSAENGTCHGKHGYSVLTSRLAPTQARRGGLVLTADQWYQQYVIERCIYIYIYLLLLLYFTSRVTETNHNLTDVICQNILSSVTNFENAILSESVGSLLPPVVHGRITNKNSCIERYVFADWHTASTGSGLLTRWLTFNLSQKRRLFCKLAFVECVWVILLRHQPLTLAKRYLKVILLQRLTTSGLYQLLLSDLSRYLLCLEGFYIEVYHISICFLHGAGKHLLLLLYKQKQCIFILFD